MGTDCYIFDRESRECASLDRLYVFEPFHYDGADTITDRLGADFCDQEKGLACAPAFAYLETLQSLAERDYTFNWLHSAKTFVAARPTGHFFVVGDSGGSGDLDCWDLKRQGQYSQVDAPPWPVEAEQ